MPRRRRTWRETATQTLGDERRWLCYDRESLACYSAWAHHQLLSGDGLLAALAYVTRVCPPSPLTKRLARRLQLASSLFVPVTSSVGDGFAFRLDFQTSITGMGAMYNRLSLPHAHVFRSAGRSPGILADRTLPPGHRSLRVTAEQRLSASWRTPILKLPLP